MKNKVRKVLRPSRAVIVVVAHGLSEVAIAESVGSAMRLKIMVIVKLMDVKVFKLKAWPNV